MEIKNVEMRKIKFLDNIRFRDIEKDISELMSSINSSGLLQPPGVYGNSTSGYVCTWGHRRIEACKKLGWKEIPVSIIADKDITEEEFLIHNAIENLHRKDITLFELGRTCDALNTRGLSISEIAARLTIPKIRVKDAISNYKVIPANFRKKTGYMLDKDKRNKKGNVPATVANMILGLRRKNGPKLDKKEINMLFKLAGKDNFGSRRMLIIASLLKKGLSARDAIEKSKNYCSKTLWIVFNNKELKNEMELMKTKHFKNFITKILTEGYKGNKNLMVITLGK